MRCFYGCLLIFFTLYCYDATEYRQERAVIKYRNPKYVSQAHSLTARRGRSGIYSTNCSFTNIHAWNNNVTYQFNYKIMHSDLDFSFKVPLCDIIKVDWMSDYAKQFSDIPMKCPLQQGKHHFFNIVIPPKNFPFPLPKGDTNFDFGMFATKTHESIINISMRIIRIK